VRYELIDSPLELVLQLVPPFTPRRDSAGAIGLAVPDRHGLKPNY